MFFNRHIEVKKRTSAINFILRKKSLISENLYKCNYYYLSMLILFFILKLKNLRTNRSRTYHLTRRLDPKIQRVCQFRKKHIMIFPRFRGEGIRTHRWQDCQQIYQSVAFNHSSHPNLKSNSVSLFITSNHQRCKNW